MLYSHHPIVKQPADLPANATGLDSLSHLEGRVREEEADGLLRYYPV